MADIDTAALQRSFAAVAAHGPDEVAQYFYSYLFLRYPETREMFPPGMARQRDRLVGALVRIVTQVDQLDELVPYLQDLGRDHRKFGALSAHYPAVGEALLAALAHFSGPSWTPELAAQWSAAYGLVAATMSGAAEQVAADEPAWWDAEVLEVDRRTFDIAVLRVRTDQPIPYLAGQSVSVEPTDRRPREWRFYTPAVAPGGLEIELHARLLPGGPVSTALVRSVDKGDALRIGPPFGRMVLDPADRRPVVMIAGSTGLAPMKAFVDQLGRWAAESPNPPRPVELYFGARSRREDYDAADLAALAGRHDWLTVTTVISDDIRWTGPRGLVGEVAVERARDWPAHEVFVCGSPEMVAATRDLLAAAGAPPEQVHSEEFGQA